MKLKAEQIREIQARAEAYQEREIRQPSIDGEQDRIKNTLDSLNEYGFVDIPALLDHIAQIEADLDKAEKRVKLLEGAIERQNNTISYLSSTNGQGFNW